MKKKCALSSFSTRNCARLPLALYFRPMASFHCAVKSGGGGRGATHAAYIEREGKYKTADKDDLEHVQTLNLPEWAANSAEFWRESDRLERANSNGYREYEIALPREMTPAQRLDFVHEFIATEIGDKNVCTFAIHCPLAALEGGEQPHAHIMFSERTHDSIERKTPEHYFKRANSKEPERGGCKKSNGVPKTPTERKAELVAFRARFADLQNKHLEKNGCTDRVTHLSLKARGLEGPQEGHHGPRAVKVIQAINAAIRPLEKEISRDTAELKIITEQEIGNDRIRDEAFAKIDGNLSDARAAWRGTAGAVKASASNLVAGHGLAADHGRNLGRAIEGTRRRVTERRLGQAVRAVIGKLDVANEIIQRTVEHVGGAYDSFRGAIKQITATLDRRRAAREQARPVDTRHNKTTLQVLQDYAENNIANPAAREVFLEKGRAIEAKKLMASPPAQERQMAARPLEDTQAQEQSNKAAEFKRMAMAFGSEGFADVLKKYPQLAGAVAVAVAIDKQAQEAGMTPEQRAVGATYVREKLANSIERGQIPPDVTIRVPVEVKRELER